MAVALIAADRSSARREWPTPATRATTELPAASGPRVLVLDEGACCRLEGDYLAKPLAARRERSMLWLGDAARVDFAFDIDQALRLLDTFHYDELIVACRDSLSGDFWDHIRNRRCAQRLPVTVI